jgi:membrane protein implicated in regulation of membrane protease activity
VFLRYWAFQLPGQGFVAIGAWAAHAAWDVPGWLGAAAVAFWVAKDAALFPFLRVAYEPRSGGGAADLVGARGTALDPLPPAGYVRISSELWRAEPAPGSAPVAAGGRVRVRAVRGLTLVVEPDAPDAP